MLHLVFVTDGDPGQLLGLCGIIKQVLDTPGFTQTPVWVGAPNQKTIAVSTILKRLTAVGRLETFAVRKAGDDPYYVQLGLRNAFNAIPEGDFLLYLDYDHVLIEQDNFVIPQSSSVFVSSEVKKNFSPPVSLGINQHLEHVNISLISGQSKYLRRIGDVWEQAYNDLRGCCPVRCRAEISFGLAAERAGVPLLPVATDIQASFADPNCKTALFHYGGDSSPSKELKTRLVRMASETRYRVDPLLIPREFKELILREVLH